MNTSIHQKEQKKGFTLLEMLIVIAVIAILLAVAIPAFTHQLEKAREATCAANRRSLLAVLKSDMMLEDYATLEDAYKVHAEKEGNDWAAQYKCPSGGKITVSDNVVYCSIHLTSDPNLDKLIETLPTSGRQDSIEVIRKFYQNNNHQLPSFAKDDPLWTELFANTKLYQNPDALFWRPSMITLDGKLKYVMFANNIPYDDKNPQGQWKGYACYYEGVYYVSGKINSYTGAIDHSSVAGYESSGLTVEQWLKKNGWQKVTP
ncbi:MAG: prepilin-type N-terminal cleavage/methylation domain-containing protein [Clostridiales bacterium]|nr:prepilin-type N-terminal cleavage/methylation domain-containing protein [Clostridiales bacterium]